MKNLLTLLMLSALMTMGLQAQEKNSKTRFYEGIVAEEIDGDLAKAINIYQELLQDKKTDRQLAAKCLYHIGLCHEKQESGKAMDFYVSLLEKYPDQGDLAILSRNRITKLENANTFIDPRDGHKYKWVKIGNQIWMAENLAYMPWVNPPLKRKDGIWVYDYGLIDGYSVEEAKTLMNYQLYGCMYNWAMAMNIHHNYLVEPWDGDSKNHQGICPTGWHLPTDSEWKELEFFLGMPDSLLNETYSRAGLVRRKGGLYDLPPVGKFFKSTSTWLSNGEGNNSSGFNALAGGELWPADSPEASYNGLGYNTSFWTATQGDSISEFESGFKNSAWFRSFNGRTSEYFNKSDITRDVYPKTNGYYVRCIKNKENFGQKEPEYLGERIYMPKATSEIDFSSMNIEVNSWNQFGGNEQHTGYINKLFTPVEPKLIVSLETDQTDYSHPVEFEEGFLYMLNDSTIGKYVDGESSVVYQNKGKIHGSTLIYNKGIIIFQTTKNQIRAINLSSNMDLWESTTNKAAGPFFAVDNNSIYATSIDGHVYSFDLMSGRLNWEINIESKIYSSPAISDGKILFASSFSYNRSQNYSLNGKLYCLDAQSGKEIWQFELPGKRSGVWSSPAISGDIVVIGGSEFYLYGIDIRNGKELWRFYSEGSVWGSPGIAEDRVYFQGLGGYFFAVDLHSGYEVWRFKFPSLQNGFFHPLIGKESVLFGSADSCLYSLDRETGKLNWKYKTPSQKVYNPILIKDMILIRGYKRIFVLK